MSQELLIQIINSYVLPALSIIVSICSVIVAVKRTGLFVDRESKELKRSNANQAELIRELRKENKELKKMYDIIIAAQNKIILPKKE